jgi:hypothetical protein
MSQRRIRDRSSVGRESMSWPLLDFDFQRDLVVLEAEGTWGNLRGFSEEDRFLSLGVS